MLLLAARKSFSFTVQFLNDNEVPLPLEGASCSFTIGEQAYSATPILTKQAHSITPNTGVVLFNLQASELDLEPGVYPFEIVLLQEGYSSIAINGELEVEESYEIGSLSQSYDEAPSTFGLIAHLKHNRLVVTSNSLVITGPEGPEGPQGRDGNPFGPVTVTYDAEDRIASLTIDGQTTTYTYNVDNTIAFDERDGVQRAYTYDVDGFLVSIDPT
jgi:YD repeat-containing protein